MEFNDTTDERTEALASPSVAREALRTPVISDAESSMVESFAVGYVTCPEDYRDAFVDSWMASHTRAEWRLIFTAYLALVTAEDVRRSPLSQPAEEGGKA